MVLWRILAFCRGHWYRFCGRRWRIRPRPIPTLTIYYVGPARLTGLYERREEKLEYYLENQFSAPADRQFFLDMDSQVDKPMAYGWAAGWSVILGNGIGGLWADGFACGSGPGFDICICRGKTAGHGYAAGDIPARKSEAGRGKAFVGAGICGGNLCHVCRGYGSGFKLSGWGLKAGPCPSS